MCIRDRRRRVVWSTVSKAADKSSITKAAKSPRSNASRMLARTRSTAVSVEWLTRYADCSDGIRRADVRYDSRHSGHKLTASKSTSLYNIQEYQTIYHITVLLFPVPVWWFYTPCLKKRPALHCPLSSPNINRFSKFFHWHILYTVCNNTVSKYPTTH